MNTEGTPKNNQKQNKNGKIIFLDEKRAPQVRGG